MNRKQDDREKDKNGSRDEGPPDQGTSAIEWIAAAVGAVVLAVMIGYMTYIGFEEVEGPPVIQIATTAAIRQDGAYLVRFKATNTGESTATELVVRATLADGDRPLESREATIDYLPVQSARSGGFYFSQDPARYRVTVEAVSFIDP